jgi:PAS domain S-box-containing protein
MNAVRVLIVEDELVSAKSLEYKLVRLGYHVMGIVTSGEEAVVRTLADPPDLVLMDIRLRGQMDGIEANRQIREKLDIPVVYLTAYAENETLKRAVTTEPFGYLLKPYEPNALRITLEMALYRYKVEQQLREDENRFRSLFMDAHAFMLIMEPETGRIIEANYAACDYYQYTHEQMVGMQIFDIDPMSPREIRKNLVKAAKQQQAFFEFQHRLADGTIRDVEVYSGPIQYQGRRLLLSNIFDITERKKTEHALKMSTSTLESIFRVAPIGIGMVINRHFVWVNPFLEKMTGYSQKELVGQSARMLYPSDEEYDRVGKEKYQEIRIHGTGSIETVFQRKDGKNFGILLASTPLDLNDLSQGVIFTATDISSLIETARALRQSETKYRQLFGTMLNGFALHEVITDKKGWPVDYRFLEANPAFAIMTGLKIPEIIGKTARKIIPGLESALIEIYGKVALTGESIVTEYYAADLDKAFYIHAYSPEKGKFATLFMDITESKKTLTALQESENRYRTIFETAAVPIWHEDFTEAIKMVNDLKFSGVSDFPRYLDEHPDFVNECARQIKIIDVNQAAVQMYEAESKEQLLDSLDIVFTSETQASLREEILGILRGDRVFEYETMNKTMKGRKLNILLRISFDTTSKDISTALVSTLDITERKANQRQQEAIIQVGAALRGANTMDEMVKPLLNIIQNVMRAKAVVMGVPSPDGGGYNVLLGVGVASALTGKLLPRNMGFIAKTMQSKEVYFTNNVRSDVELMAEFDSTYTKCMAAVPLSIRNESLGVIAVGRDDDFEAEDINILTAIGEMCSNAVQRTTLYAITQQNLRRMEALHRVDRTITSSTDLLMTLKILMNEIQYQLGIDAVVFYTYERATNTILYASSQGLHAPHPRRYRGIRIDEGFTGEVVLERKPIKILDVRTDDSIKGKLTISIIDEGVHSYLGFPLVGKEGINGVMEIYHRSRLEPDQSWLDFLDTLAGQAAVAIENSSMFNRLQRSNMELVHAYDSTLEGWARALELRDVGTEGHSRNVMDVTLKLAVHLGVHQDELSHIRRGALLHDIGKMGIPDRILLKPGPLTADEWELMKKHPAMAYEMLSGIDYLRPALDIPYCHHERWDGNGYPRQLRGNEIPLSARIFGVVDVWDALTHDRPYRKAWSVEESRKHLQDNRGIMFDPRVVNAFLEMDIASILD